MRKNFYFIYVLFAIALLVTGSATAQNYFDNFPVKADPKIVGEKLSKHFIEEYIMPKYVHGMGHFGLLN